MYEQSLLNSSWPTLEYPHVRKPDGGIQMGGNNYDIYKGVNAERSGTILQCDLQHE